MSTANAETLTGGTGDDTLIGNGGNDSLSGGAGTDIAWYQGDATEYTVNTISGGYTVADSVVGRDGTDTLTGIETLQFRDRTIYLDSRNTAPLAKADSVSGTEDVPLVISASSLLVNDRDWDGDALSVSAVSNALHGTVSLANGQITFTPEANYSGTAGYSYTLSDGMGGTDTGSVAITLAAAPDAAVMGADAIQGTEDGTLYIPVAMRRPWWRSWTRCSAPTRRVVSS